MPNIPGTAENPSSQHRVPHIQFNGTGIEGGTFYVEGRVHHVPPQMGIPGWQRVLILKYYRDDLGFLVDELYAYEGCVLPGGQIIVGRWWDATGFNTSGDESGPFIFWNVLNNDDVELIEEDDSDDVHTEIEEMDEVLF